MDKTSKVDEHIITGLIIASDWDRRGNVTDIAIYSDDEEIYLVTHGKHKQRLISMVPKPVRIVGEVVRNATGRTFIHVRSWQEILNPNEQSASSP